MKIAALHGEEHISEADTKHFHSEVSFGRVSVTHFHMVEYSR